MKKEYDLKQLILASLFSSLIAVGAFIKIPLFAVPITLQTLFVVLSALVLEKKYAMLSVLIYIFIGLIGFPVFASGGGITYVLKPTFGYLIAFLVSAYVISLLKNKINVYVASFVGIIIIYVFGIIYFVLIGYFLLGKVYAINFLATKLFLVFLPGDIISVIVAVLVYKQTEKLLRR